MSADNSPALIAVALGADCGPAYFLAELSESRIRPPMKTLTDYRSINTAADYDHLLNALYGRVRQRAEEIDVPEISITYVTGNEPPSGEQYPEAISVLYGIGYSLKMGLKYDKLPRPAEYFDYKVGALETLWWSVGPQLDITNAETLRWKAYLMMPAFVSPTLFDSAREVAMAKHPEVPYERAVLSTLHEGHCVQMLHVGAYDQEQPTIEALHAYAAENGLTVTGKHHEIYISDPRKTRTDKLKTVIRLSVTR